MVNLNGVTISHYVPGRVRVRIVELKRNESLAQKIRTYASGMELVDNIEVNTLTGSVLVEYDPEKKDDIKNLVQQAKQFNLLPEEIELEQLHKIIDGKENPREISEEIRFFFSKANDQVKNWTGDRAGLNDLIPLGLFGLGIRSLLIAENITGPPWHTYLWFAFSTFLILNPKGSFYEDNESKLHAPSA